MNPSLLPPRGIFIPTSIIFDTQLPTAVILTWIRLRCLAWDGWSTPPLSIPELASLLGIHPNRLSKHLYQLHAISALSWQTTQHGKVILSFPEELAAKTDHPENKRKPARHDFSVAVDRDAPGQTSYFPRQIMGYLAISDNLEEYSPPIDPEDMMVEQVEVENYLAIHK